MTAIEQVSEAAGIRDPDYTKRVLTDEEIRAGRHRKWVGGRWDGHGRRQVDFLVDRGLEPHMRLLDVGCGSFRAGVHFVDYLDAGNYYGVDANLSVMEAGYEHELSEQGRQKLPRANLRATDRFQVDFGGEFDVAIAQSVFTHMSLNFIRLCLYRVAEVMKTGGRFFVTFNEAEPDFPLDGVLNAKKRPRFSERNVYWYYRSDIQWAASFAPWEYRYIGDWGHPRGQMMAELVKR